MTERILVISHAHPDFQKGGAEITASNICLKYRQEGHIATFLGCIDRGRWPEGTIRMRRENDYTWEQSADVYTLHTQNLNTLHTNFADFVRVIRPTRIHMHHYLGVGLETIFALKNLAPDAALWLTLHEYIAICPHFGQMIKPKTYQLCYESSPEECHRCIPVCTIEDLWLRKYFTQQAFALIDRFISPSKFLKQRYVEWGLEAERISVEENWMPPIEKLPPRELRDGETRNRFGFFGQITPFKGLDVVLEALLQLPRGERHQIVLEVHGGGEERQSQKFQCKIQQLSKKLVKEGVVQWRGPYQPHQLHERMNSVDWVVVPSIWWENSPLVIQEAKGFGRPLLVSNIGGMAEKVKEGIDGWHVPVGNHEVWGKTLLESSKHMIGIAQ